MKVIWVIVSTALIVNIAFAQVWKSVEAVSVLNDSRSTRFTLDGKFITPPQRSAVSAPSMVVQCSHGAGDKPGKRIASWLIVGAILDSPYMDFRIDEGKPQKTSIGLQLSNDLSSVFFSEPDLTQFLYGHIFKNKIDAGRPVRKLIIVMTEHLGRSIVMQFDMPDPTEPARACGLLK
jgi:hypothetical protein